jgi:hypothetical protein
VLEELREQRRRVRVPHRIGCVAGVIEEPFAGLGKDWLICNAPRHAFQSNGRSWSSPARSGPTTVRSTMRVPLQRDSRSRLPISGVPSRINSRTEERRFLRLDAVAVLREREPGDGGRLDAGKIQPRCCPRRK